MLTLTVTFRKIKKFFAVTSAIRIKKLKQVPFYIRTVVQRVVWKVRYRFFTNKVPLNRVNFNIVYGCNLGCDYCSHMSQFDKGFVTLSELVHWYQTWNKKIAPYRVSLLGGEPLLHPQFGEVLRETKHCFPNAKIDILTNGLALPQQSISVIKLIKEYGCSIWITKHFDDTDYNKKFDAAIAVLQEYRIPYDIGTSHYGWQKVYNISDTGLPMPYNSDPQKAWDGCGSKNNCLTIMDNCLFKCASLSAYMRMAALHKIPEEWNRVLTYRPLTEYATKNEIMNHVTSGAMPECSVCPEKWEFIPTSEVTSKFHRLCELRRQKEQQYSV